jgi:hypothetical protein
MRHRRTGCLTRGTARNSIGRNMEGGKLNKHEPLSDMPTQAQAKATLAITRDEILMGRNVVRTQFNRLEDSVRALVEAFIDGRYAEMKQASEAVRTESASLSVTAKQIEFLASGLVTGCCHQLTRRPR